MQVLSTLIVINRNGKLPVYLQIANQLMALVKAGTLRPGYKLLSTRELASSLKVHRRMVVQAYDELLAQGWLESHTGKGTFVAKHLPETRPVNVESNVQTLAGQNRKAGFQFESLPHLARPVLKPNSRLHLDDGFPDPRLAPREDLARAYRSQVLQGNAYLRLGYGDTTGSAWLRQQLSAHLNETRGLKTTASNILITRGVIMGLHLFSTLLLRPGDRVAVDAPGWFGANMNFVQAGASVCEVPVDRFGMDMQALEQICEQKPVRMVYVTSHHHYPTTVALRADRRIALLRLAEQYRFAIFEDDYDYDFHYQSKPLLPLAGADPFQMVVYCGSFTKTISPAFRIGYLVGPEDLISELALLRRIIDRQGDQMLENAVAELLQTGVIQRHLRKSVRVYKQRRDLFCDLLKTELGNYVDFQAPDGGMAVWTQFDANINLPRLAEQALRRDLFLSGAASPFEIKTNAVRLGFASSNPDELEESVAIIKSLL
ncbi:MocR-like pyridoxine biosynthesis transcription factor PdxR [Dyadobacter aurulentus]|uniref:MocR-like pyridoxine biosynthesis transcription factor PdxR n=1 Tax=Dyadobacter sp. UC 10 TaxID=2605428 RepID=UPI0011F3F157|nr:PLP-dependent aminotransferase family protein [Dyadobacter sp. UC 10]KAA0993122.1 PLP-dependent aminotransferase family protein [Dyadobacter sp. UC 10]